MFNFIVIDPRNPIVPANCLGIEVTNPEIAARCDLGNIDPQHGCNVFPPDPPSFAVRGDAAIASALGWPLPAAPADPSKCVTLATIRPDLDAFGAMAVLALRAAGVKMTADALARIEAIAAADGNARTTWEPQPLPTAKNPWPPGVEIGSRRELAAIASVVSDHKLSPATRVAVMAAWLLGGEEPSAEVVETASQAVFGVAAFESCVDPVATMREARARVEAERADMIAALGDGRISVELAACPRCGEAARAHERGDAECTACGWDFSRIAVVRSAHRAATSLGQSVAPLAICFHPAFPWPQGHTTPKATIAWAVPPGAEVVKLVRDALNAAEREKIATQIDSIDLGVTYEGDWPGVFFDAHKGQSDPGAATLLRAGDATAALDVIANIAPANAARFAEDVAVIKTALKSEWGGNLASGILGSPQGRASMLSEEDEIVNIVRETLSA